MKRNFLSITIMSLLLFSCKKESTKSSCPDPDTVTINTNGPVIQGWPLTLSTYDEFGLIYTWTGPNDWKVSYDFHSSEAYHQGKQITTMADNGTYKVELKSEDGCVLYQGSVDVKIIAAPSPVCNIANNTSASNIIGVGDVSFSNIYFQGGGGIYSVQSSAQGQTLTFNFNGNDIPKPGVYKSSGYFATDETTVGVYITSGVYDFIDKGGQDVYVNVVNGKTRVTFCNADFTNPLGSQVIKISANLTQP